MNINKKDSNKISWMISITLIFIFLSSSTLLVSYNQKFLMKHSGNSANISVTEKEDIIENIINYLKDDEQKIFAAYFNQREIDHMEDVKVIFMFIQAILLFSILCAPILIIYSIRYYCEKNSIKDWYYRIFGQFDFQLLKKIIIANSQQILKTLKRVNIISIVFSAILILFFWNFNLFFNTFHKLLFQDGSWLFNANDLLILLFPFNLFKTAFLYIILLYLLFSFIAFALFYSLNRYFFP